MRHIFTDTVKTAKNEILRGIWKKRPTPLAKVCGRTVEHNNAMNELLSEGKVEIYSKPIFIKSHERELEYYRWVPFTPVDGGFKVQPLLIRIIA